MDLTLCTRANPFAPSWNTSCEIARRHRWLLGQEHDLPTCACNLQRQLSGDIPGPRRISFRGPTCRPPSGMSPLPVRVMTDRQNISETRKTTNSDPGFFQIARSRPVVTRAVRIALVVGTILAVINHGDRLLVGDINMNAALKILLSFCVPYSVSTYSSVLAIRENSITQKLE